MIDNLIDRGPLKNIEITKYPKYNTEMERYTGLSSWVIECIIQFTKRPKIVYIENYAYSASGLKSFTNCGKYGNFKICFNQL